MKFKAFGTILSILFFCLVSGNSFYCRASETVYAGPGGNCGGHSPCQDSIQACLDMAGTDLLVNIRQGTYIEALSFPDDGGFRARSFECSQTAVVDGSMTLCNGSVALKSGTFILQNQGLVPVEVPNVVGKHQYFAKTEIAGSSLVAGEESKQESETVEKERVIEQNPAAGISMAPGNPVDLLISLGPTMIEVPDVTGMSEQDAIDAISNSGLLAGAVFDQYSETVPQGSVINQSPLPGVSVKQDVPVHLLVSIGSNGGGLPPDPSTVATDLETSTVTQMAASVEFLFTGSDPVQKGIVPGTMDADRICVIKGKTMERDGEALPGVEISVQGRPEFGTTLSRADGLFDLAVNGGETLVLDYQKSGFLPAQRQVQAPWEGFAHCPDTALVAFDDWVSPIYFPMGEFQVAQGSQVCDSDGNRQATLLVPSDTEAELVFPDGDTQSVDTLNVRFTEYTAGPNGPEAMPAELPPTSAYTYAVELTADEVAAAGADHVRFSKSVFLYLENFIGIPVGTIVPAGFYDRSEKAWIASRNGRVVKIVSIDGLGSAELDLDGDGDADQDDLSLWSAYEITLEETVVLGGLYSPGQELWRVPVTHFSTPDLNFGAAPLAGAQAPGQSMFSFSDSKIDIPSTQGGFGIIDIENQVFRESVRIVGTPYSLNYASDRVEGRKEAYETEIPLSGDTLPDGVKEIVLEIWIAGRQFAYRFDAEENQSYKFAWDGKDAYGRKLQGAHKAYVRVGYVYDAVYQEPPDLEQAFGLLSGIPISSSAARSEWTLWQEHEVILDLPATWFAMGQGLGGWTISDHHAYDVNGGILQLGTGRDRTWRSGVTKERIITPVAGNGEQGYNGDELPALEAKLNEPTELEIAPDGSLYIVEIRNDRVRMVDKDGIIHTVAGNGENTSEGDGGHPTEASFQMPWGIALRGDNEMYIAEYQGNRIRKITGLNGREDSVITNFAGTGEEGDGGDGGPATEAQFRGPTCIAAAPDGTLYIADFFNNRIRRVGTDGIITTVAGNGNEGFSGDGGPAAQAELHWPGGVAVGPDGALFIADTYNCRVRRVGTDGIITTVAGTGIWATNGDGGPAAEAAINGPFNVVAAPDGTLYIADTSGQKIRRVDTQGIITTFAGTGERGNVGDEGPATAAMLDTPYGLALAPDGTVYVTGSNCVRKILPPNPASPNQEFLIPSEDGGRLYKFDTDGRHQSTHHALTGATLLTFGYDDEGRLVSLEDAYGKTTSIERDQDGTPTAVVGPFDQRTELTTNTRGYLESVADPSSRTVTLTYSDDGLLESLTDPNSNVYEFYYSESGLLDGGRDPAGGSSDFFRATTPDGIEIVQVTGEMRTTGYLAESISMGGRRQTITRSDGTQLKLVEGVDGDERREGTIIVDSPNGTRIEEVLGPDPRFGMQKPVVSSRTVDVPYQGDRLVSTTTAQRTAVLADPEDPTSLQTLTDTIADNGKVFTNVFDASSRTITRTTPEGRQSVGQIDEQGRLIMSDTPGFGQIGYSYDSLGRLESVTRQSADGARAGLFSYDAAGYLHTETDHLNRVVTYQYDAAGRIAILTRPDQKQITYAYDANGNLSGITPPGKPVHRFGYTEIDLPGSYTAPAVDSIPTETVFFYDGDRQKSRIDRPDGKSISLEYDAAGRISTATVDPDGDQIAYTYDNDTGQMDQVQGPHGITLQFDYYGCLSAGMSCTGPVACGLTRDYDQDFRVTQLNIQNAPCPIGFQYDDDSLLTAVGYEMTNGLLTLDRDSQSGLVSATRFGPAPETVTDARTYNGFGELTGYAAACDGAPCFELVLTRDAIGRVTEKQETIEGATTTHRYVYDLAGRLAEVRDGNDSLVSQYTYDDNGNRLGYAGPFGNASGTCDDQDRLVTYGDATYEFTENGDLLSKTEDVDTTAYAYDAFGNLTSVSLPDGRVVSYLSDGNNRRVVRKIDGIVDKAFLYDDGFYPVAELDADGNIASLFLYGTRAHVPDLMLKDTGGGNFVPYRIFTDHLGSPRLVVNAENGTEIAQRLDYDEFGRVLTDTNPGFQPFGFAGGLYDPDTGLTRFGFRDYDAETGRWTTKDPLAFQGGDSCLYSYNGNDPVNGIDPSGLKPFGVGANPEKADPFAYGMDPKTSRLLFGLGFGNGMGVTSGDGSTLITLTSRENPTDFAMSADNSKPANAVDSFDPGKTASDSSFHLIEADRDGLKGISIDYLARVPGVRNVVVTVGGLIMMPVAGPGAGATMIIQGNLGVNPLRVITEPYQGSGMRRE